LSKGALSFLVLSFLCSKSEKQVTLVSFGGREALERESKMEKERVDGFDSIGLIVEGKKMEKK